MPNDNLLSITPIDGRYESQTKSLANYFSEFALIRTRVEVEIEWLLLISNNKSLKFIPEVSNNQQKQITNIFKEFSIQDARQIKKIEKKTNHDVKAVELFIVEKLKDPDLPINYTLEKFDEPAQRYCPVGVYEVQNENNVQKFVINSQNCIHCKTCDIKEPSQNITWVTPEGGGGPKYGNM